MRNHVIVELHGSVCLVRGAGQEAEWFLEENMPLDATRFGGAYVVEPRYVGDIMEDLHDRGFTVEVQL